MRSPRAPSAPAHILADAVAYRFAFGQSLERIRRRYRLSRRDVEQALRDYMNRRRGK